MPAKFANKYEQEARPLVANLKGKKWHSPGRMARASPQRTNATRLAS